MIAKSLFGKMPDGRKVYAYTFTDDEGQSVVVSEYGCAILEINVFGRFNPSVNKLTSPLLKGDEKRTCAPCQGGEGRLAGEGVMLYDVALGYDTLAEYIDDTRNFGATIGRYANRIAGGKFTLNGVTYWLPQNDGRNTLHGGFNGFGKRLFSSEVHDDCVVFKLNSPDLDEGFPGNFALSVTVSFNDGRLMMKYDYVCDKDTPASITNHNYFNLNGHGKGTILNHSVKINAERYCRANDELLALAPCVNVEGTPFDFRNGGKIINKILPYSNAPAYSPEITNAGGGFDHCFEISDNKKAVAEVTGDVTGIKLAIYSDMPALQFYTGNQIGHARGKNGAVYNSFDGFAMECQKFPNAINEPSFPDCVIKAGQPESSYIEYRFTH